MVELGRARGLGHRDLAGVDQVGSTSSPTAARPMPSVPFSVCRVSLAWPSDAASRKASWLGQSRRDSMRARAGGHNVG